MSYTLKTYNNDRLLETYENRSAIKLRLLMEQPEMHNANKCDAWGTLLNTANKFEIFNSRRIKIFSGSAYEAETFIKHLY